MQTDSPRDEPILHAGGHPAAAADTDSESPVDEPTTTPTSAPSRTPSRFVNFVMALHDGALGLDGVGDFLDRDPESQVISEGQYDGLPVMRPVTDTIDGVPLVEPASVIALRNQRSPENNGIWELLTDSNGVEGTYAVRTQVWNSSFSNDPSDHFYAPSGTPFLVLNGDHLGNTLWVTATDGLATDVEQITSRHGVR